MFIQALGNQNFKGENFRIDDCWIRANGIYTPSTYIREYSSPKAEGYFIKAQHAKTIAERQKYFNLMGEYKLIQKEKHKTSSNILTKITAILKKIKVKQ